MAQKLMQRHQEGRGTARWDKRWQRKQMEAKLQQNKPKKERKA